MKVQRTEYLEALQHRMHNVGVIPFLLDASILDNALKD